MCKPVLEGGLGLVDIPRQNCTIGIKWLQHYLKFETRPKWAIICNAIIANTHLQREHNISTCTCTAVKHNVFRTMEMPTRSREISRSCTLYSSLFHFSFSFSFTIYSLFYNVHLVCVRCSLRSYTSFTRQVLYLLLYSRHSYASFADSLHCENILFCTYLDSGCQEPCLLILSILYIPLRSDLPPPPLQASAQLPHLRLVRDITGRFTRASPTDFTYPPQPRAPSEPEPQSPRVH